MLWPLIGLVVYAFVGLVVAQDVWDTNRNRLIPYRQSPGLRGALWLPFVVAGSVMTLWDIGAGALKRGK